MFLRNVRSLSEDYTVLYSRKLNFSIACFLLLSFPTASEANQTIVESVSLSVSPKREA
jgi:hypothetical protein